MCIIFSSVSSFFCNVSNFTDKIYTYHQWVIFCSRQKSIPNSQVDEWNHMILRVIWWWSEASGAMIDSIPLPSRQSTRRMLPKMGSYLVVLFSTTELVYLCGCTNILMVRTRAYVPSHRNEMIQHWMLCHEVSLMLWGHVSRHSLCEPPNPLS